MSTILQAGTILNNQRYRIVRLIGRGGMGAVYEAIDQTFESTVALKQVIVPPATSPEQADRFVRAFEREARMLHHLEHPALPRVSDYFASSEGRFLVMKYVPGHDLKEMLQQRLKHSGVPFTVDDVLPWLDQVLDVLDYLHHQDPPVIHRDLKPHNLKVTPQGQVLLLDFGIAKGVPAQNHDTSASIAAYTLDYAPLEQIEGTGTDPRSDLFSLGATMYHMLTGNSLKKEQCDTLSRSAAVVYGKPDPLNVPPDIPEPVRTVLRQALALNPAHRPPSAAAMKAALHADPASVGASTAIISPDRPTVGVSPDRPTVGVSPDRPTVGVSPDRPTVGVSPNGPSAMASSPRVSPPLELPPVPPPPPAERASLLPRVLIGVGGVLLLLLLLLIGLVWMKEGAGFASSPRPTETETETGMGAETATEVAEDVPDSSIFPTLTPTPTPTPTPIPTPIPPPLNPLFPVALWEWRDDLTRLPETFGQCDGYWCYVPGDTYPIGGWAENENPDDDTETTVTLDHFWVAKFPVTVQQYRQFMEAGGYTNMAYWTSNGWEWKEEGFWYEHVQTEAGWQEQMGETSCTNQAAIEHGKGRIQPYCWGEERFNHPEQPVVGITWYEAVAFTNWLNAELADALPEGYALRIPTEAEWEVACSADGDGNRRTYPWGEEEPAPHLVDVWKDQSEEQPAPVGTHSAGAAACGAQDMVGGVWEATTSSLSDPTEVVSDLSYFDGGPDGMGIATWRGLSWWWRESSALPDCGAWHKNWPGYSWNGEIYGLRVVLAPSPTAP